MHLCIQHRNRCAKAHEHSINTWTTLHDQMICQLYFHCFLLLPWAHPKSLKMKPEKGDLWILQENLILNFSASTEPPKRQFSVLPLCCTVMGLHRQSPQPVTVKRKGAPLSLKPCRDGTMLLDHWKEPKGWFQTSGFSSPTSTWWKYEIQWVHSQKETQSSQN